MAGRATVGTKLGQVALVGLTCWVCLFVLAVRTKGSECVKLPSGAVVETGNEVQSLLGLNLCFYLQVHVRFCSV